MNIIHLIFKKNSPMIREILIGLSDAKKKKGNIDTRVSLKLSFIRLRIPIRIWHFLIFTLKIYMLGDKQDKLRNQFLVLHNSKTFLTVCIYTISRTFAMFQENIPSLSF